MSSSDYNYDNYTSGGSGGSAAFQSDDITAADIAKDVVILFLSGVAILVGLVVFVYVIAMICDRFCRCCGFFAPLHTGGQRYIEGGQVARDAGLTGMTKQERRAVLEKVLVGKPYCKHTFCKSKDEVSNVKTSNDPSRTEDVNEKGGDKGMVVETGELDPNSEEGIREGSNQKGETSVEGPTTDESARIPNSEGQIEGENGSDILDHKSQADVDVVDEKHLVENDSTVQCAICINDYEENDEVVLGASCSHMFHRECVLEWLENHDGCPWCRKNMMTSAQMREAAPTVLGHDRMVYLAVGFSSPSALLDLESDLELGNVGDRFENDGNNVTISNT